MNSTIIVTSSNSSRHETSETITARGQDSCDVGYRSFYKGRHEEKCQDGPQKEQHEEKHDDGPTKFHPLNMKAFSTYSSLGTLICLALLSFICCMTNMEGKYYFHMEKINQRQLHRGSPMDYSEYSCDHLNIYTSSKRHHDRAKQCAFASTCNDGEGIYAPVVYCSDKFTINGWKWLLSVPMIIWLTVLFRMVGSTAEDFFSPSLEMMSINLGLPPRFAGVTLLALGNGAPDIASTVNAILGDVRQGYLMGVGELAGAGMFISTVITGIVTLYHQPPPIQQQADDSSNQSENKDSLSRSNFRHVLQSMGGSVLPCKGALVRDVVMFIVTLIAVYWQFSNGLITNFSIRLLFGMYVAYVAAVLVADVYHRTVVIPRVRNKRHSPPCDCGAKTSQEIPTNILPEQKLAVDEAKCVESETPGEIDSEKTALLSSAMESTSFAQRHLSTCSSNMALSMERGEFTPANAMEFAIESLSNYGTNYSDRINDSGWGVKFSTSQNSEDEVSSDEEMLIVYHTHYHGGVQRFSLKSVREAKQSSLQNTQELDLQARDAENIFGSAFNPQDDDESLLALPNTPPGELASTPGRNKWFRPCFALCGLELFQLLRSELYHFLHEQIVKDIYLNKDNSLVEKVLLTLELPFILCRMFTIPIPCNGYYCRPILGLSTMLSPVWLSFYLFKQFDINVFLQFEAITSYEDDLESIDDDQSLNFVEAGSKSSLYFHNTADTGHVTYKNHVLLILLLCVPVVLGLLVLLLAPPSSYVNASSIRPTQNKILGIVFQTSEQLPWIMTVPLGLYGFAVAATWIDAIADQLVDVLSFLGIVGHIPGPIMGLTVLAVGNSFGDLAANVTMARKGLANMAITACFAGPVFNMLIGVGLGFTLLGHSIHTAASNPSVIIVPVHLTNALKAAFVFSILNCVLLLVSGRIIGRGTIHKSYGYAAFLLYLIYTCISLAV